MKKVMSIMFVLGSFSAISGVWDVPILYNGQYVFGYGIDDADIQNISNLATTGGGVFEIPMLPDDFADSPERYWCDEDYDAVLRSIRRSAGYGSAYYSNINSNANVVVRMPSTVEWIGSYAFKGLPELKEVVLPPNIKEIGCSAFSSCWGLKFMDIPDSVSKMGDEVFAGCGALKRVTLSKNCQIIPPNAFAECTRLEEIDIPSGVTSIGVRAFIECSALKAIIIPDSVTNIDTKAFYNCRNLQTVVIKGKNIRLGAEAFSQCYALKTIDMSCFNEIGGAAFFACPSIEDISLSADVTISPFAFMGCNGIKNIKIVAQDAYSSGFTNMFFSTEETFDVACDIVGGDIRPVKMDTGFIPNIHSLSNVTDFIVAEGATEGSDRLYLPPNAKRCTIPASMTNLTERLIRGGVKYTVDKNNQYYCSDDDGSLFTKDKRKLLAYGNPNRLWHIVGFNGWIGSSVPPEEIGDGAFQNCDNVRWMTFPQGVTKIGARAFKGCAKLESISFEGPRITQAPFGSLSLGAGKTNVISIINGGPIKYIGESAFADCPDLRCELYFPDTLSTLGDMAFANCPKLSSARFYGATPAVKDIYSEKGVFHNSGVSCEYRFDYTNKWATAMRTYTIVDGQVVTNDNIVGYWQEAHCHPDHIENKADEIIVYDGAYRLTLDANDGACAVSTLIVESGEKIDDMPDAMRDGYSFIGWFDAFDGGTKVSTNTVIECDMTLYAHWTENPAPTPTYTETTPVPVQHDWLAKYSGILTAAGNDYEAAAMRPTGKKDGKGNALSVWHDYVAGTDPTNLNSRFMAKVDLANGTPVVKWEPDLNEDGTKSERFYKVFGKKTLATNENWMRIADEAGQKDYRFFKVTVNMEETPDTEEELKFGDGSGTGGGTDGGGVNVDDNGDERPITLESPYNFSAAGTGYGYIQLRWRSDMSYSSDSSKWVDFCVYRANVNDITMATKVATMSMHATYIPKEYEDRVDGFDTYYYWIRTETGTARSEWSAVASAALYLSGPKNLTATCDRYEGVMLEWDALSEATSYKVYADDEGGWSYNFTREVGETTGTSILDDDAPIGTKVRYKVLVVSPYAYEYSYSTVLGARYSGEQTAPDIAGSGNTEGIGISWQPVIGAVAYDIYRNTRNESSSATKIGTLASSGLNNGNSIGYTDKTVDIGTTYYYWVKAVYASNESGFSQVFSAAKFAPHPTNVKATSLRSDGILLTWEPAVGATSYRIYSGSVMLTETTACRWLDTSIAQGSSRTYTKVTSVCAAGEYEIGGYVYLTGYRTSSDTIASVTMTGASELELSSNNKITLLCTATMSSGEELSINPDSWDFSELPEGAYQYEKPNEYLYLTIDRNCFIGAGAKTVTIWATWTANERDCDPTVYNLSHTVVIHPSE